MNCKNCIHFNPFTDHATYGYPIGYGRCGHSKIVDDLAVYPKKDNTMPKDGVYATCDESRGELQVGEDFGCIHFDQIVRA